MESPWRPSPEFAEEEPGAVRLGLPARQRPRDVASSRARSPRDAARRGRLHPIEAPERCTNVRCRASAVYDGTARLRRADRRSFRRGNRERPTHAGSRAYTPGTIDGSCPSALHVNGRTGATTCREFGLPPEAAGRCKERARAFKQECARIFAEDTTVWVTTLW